MQLLILLICLLGILLTQTLIGGARMVFAFPGYLLIAGAGILAVFIPFRKVHPGVRLPAVIATILLIGYVVIRSFSSPVEYLARADRFMVLAAVVVYLLTAHYLTSPSQRLWMVYGLLGFSLLHLAGGVLQFAWGDNFMLLATMPAGSPVPEIIRGADYGWRASGFYICPNHLAGLLETLAMLALARLCFGRAKALGRMLALYFAITALVGVALTGSRGGYLSTAAGMVALFALAIWTVKKLRSRKFWVTLSIVGAVALVLITGGVFAMMQSDLIRSRLDQLADTNNMRLLMWAAALKQFELSPIFGTGSGTYLYYGREFRSANVQNDPQHVHNDYLELLCEYGIVGVLLFAVFLSVHLFYGFKTLSSIVRKRLRPAKRIFSNELALLIGVIASVAALMVHSIVDFNCHVPGNVLYFAFLFGVLACPTSDPTLVSSPAPRASRSIRFVLPAISAMLAVLGAPLLRGEYHGEWARVHLRNQLCYRILAQTQAQAGWTASFENSGVLLPASGTELEWHDRYLHDHLLPESIRHAEAALETDKENPDLYYYLGEARHFLALASAEAGDKRMLFAAAGDAYAEGYRLFPSDGRLQSKLARAYDIVGIPGKAEELYVKALRGDPNLGNLYAAYGGHLWERRKLARAEAYFHRALQLDSKSTLARIGLREIARVRALAKDHAYVEEYGDPLESFDMELPTEEEEARGVVPRGLDQ